MIASTPPVLLSPLRADGFPPPPADLVAAEDLLEQAAAIYRSAGPFGAPGYAEAAAAFLGAAAALRRCDAGEYARSARANREIAYRNSALAWSFSSRPETGISALEEIDDPDAGPVLRELIDEVGSQP